VEWASLPSFVYGWRWRGSIHDGVFCFKQSLGCWCVVSTCVACLAAALKMAASGSSDSSPSVLVD
jgi:hypothetical protein